MDVEYKNASAIKTFLYIYKKKKKKKKKKDPQIPS